MPRADLIINLVKAGSEGNRQLFRSTVEALAAEERAKHHHQLADRLVSNLASGEDAHRPVGVVKAFDGGHGGLLFEVQPERTLESLILSEDTKNLIREVIEEHSRVELLRSYGLEPRNRLLLVGPPGNGKTTAVEALAAEMAIPLFVVRYEAIVGSYLGETSSRLKKLFDFVRTHHCVLFFDEFDTLGKERGDVHDTGEIKRVVSSLLLQMDSLPSHVVIATATNHPELLDRAVWRRFQLRLRFPPPTAAQVEEILKGLPHSLGLNQAISTKDIATRLKASSFSEVEDFCADIRRRFVLALPNSDLKSIIARRVKYWTQRVNPAKT